MNALETFSSKADMGALVKLLLEKQVITLEEWAQASVEGQEAEAERQQEWLQEKMRGTNPNVNITTV